MEYEIPILNSRLIQHPPSYMSCQNSFSEIFSKFMYDNKESIAGQLKTIQDLRYTSPSTVWFGDGDYSQCWIAEGEDTVRESAAVGDWEEMAVGDRRLGGDGGQRSESGRRWQGHRDGESRNRVSMETKYHLFLFLRSILSLFYYSSFFLFQ
jgi:hypothetical protein